MHYDKDMTPAELTLIFAFVTQQFDLPKGLLDAVCFVESSHRPHVIVRNDGGSASIGVCQLKLNTARLVGFYGTEEELINPIVNSYYAGKYLHKQLTRYGNNPYRAIAAYNAGTHRIGANGVTRNWKYVDKVLKAWSERRVRTRIAKLSLVSK